MSLKNLQLFFMYSSYINIGLFILTFVAYRFGKKLIYKYHGKWFNLSNEQTFDTIYYCLMVFYKLFIVFFNIVPCVVLYFFIKG